MQKHQKVLAKLLLLILFAIHFNFFAQTGNCPTCPPNTNTSAIVKEYFDSGTYSFDLNGAPANQTPHFQSAPNPYMSNGSYAVTSQSASFWNPQWSLINDNTPNSNNYYLLCDGNTSGPTYLFRKTNVPVVQGRTYIFCAWLGNVTSKNITVNDPHTNHILPKFEMRINGQIDGSPLTLNNGEFWKSKSLTWVANTSLATLEIIMTSTGAIGNDVALDDITFTECKPNIPCRCTLTPVKASWYGANGLTNNTNLTCGNPIKVGNVCVCQPIKVQFNYTCEGTDCATTSSWVVNGPNGFHVGPTTASGGILNASFIPTEAGLYTVLAKVKCGTTECECKILISVDRIIQCKSVLLEHETLSPNK